MTEPAVRFERGIEQDALGGGRVFRGPTSPDFPWSFCQKIIDSGTGNAVPAWRRVEVGPWRAGEPPEVDMELTAGTPENLRALVRLLAPYAGCTGHRENCGSNCLGGGLCQVLALAYVNVGAELERRPKS